MRLIDADTLFKFLKGQREKETGAYSKGRNNGINIAIGAIRNEQICPTVDAVPVVRCKDCRYRHELKVTGGVLCDHEEGLMSTKLKDTDFCPYGERRVSDV